MKKAIWTGILCGLVPLAASATLIVDNVDWNDGWTNIGGGWFTTGVAGLAAKNGTGFWVATNAENNRGAWKLFGDTFTAEELKVTYYVGDRNDFAWTGGVTAYLFADANNDNTYQWTERITTTDTESRPAPVDGGWSTWVDTYTITAGTQTADGDSVFGKKIGFFAVSHVGSGENMAFDGLTIETIPEPATLSILSAFGGVLLCMRRFLAM